MIIAGTFPNRRPTPAAEEAPEEDSATDSAPGVPQPRDGRGGPGAAPDEAPEAG